MAMRYGYFDSEITGVDENGMPIFDRAETSDLFRMLFANLVSNGVLATPGDCFQVVAGAGMTVRIRPGFAMIKGAFAYDADEATVTLAAANANLPRVDRVVLRCNYYDRCCEIIVKTGTPNTIPVAPELLQPVNGDYYELGLALITVAANQAAITQSSISDTRADSSVCGLITQLIDHIDTSEFMQQLTTWQEEYAAEQQAAFSTWFEEMKDQLSEDAAGNLQLEIDNLSQSAEAHDESIGQINEIIGDADMGTTATTVTAAIKELVNKIGSTAMGTTATTVTAAIKELVNKIGSTAMGTTATTVTAAIKELHDNVEVLYEDALTIRIGLDRDNVTIAAGDSFAWFGAHVNLPGYRPKSIAGTRLYNATQNGANYLNCGFSFCEVYRNTSTQNDDIDFAIRNHGTTAAKIHYRIEILYYKVR